MKINQINLGELDKLTCMERLIFYCELCETSVTLRKKANHISYNLCHSRSHFLKNDKNYKAMLRKYRFKIKITQNMSHEVLLLTTSI